jgi:hypothetical protein
MAPMPALLLIAVLAGSGFLASTMAARDSGLPAETGSALARQRRPVLVELFTSEGCSSCPPADAVLARLLREQPVDGVEILPLSLHVDYWNRLGWKDPYSAKAYSARQQRYAKVFGEDKLYTPQIVVDGREEAIGSDESAVRRLIIGAAQHPHLPVKMTARAVGRSLTISIDLPPAPAGDDTVDVFVALTEDDLSSAVKRGENVGRTLTHVAVVRALQTLGTLETEAFVADGRLPLEPGWKPARMRAVVWLQGRAANRVYGAASAAWAVK